VKEHFTDKVGSGLHLSGFRKPGQPPPTGEELEELWKKSGS
jgi:hypothetical protein